MFITEGIRATFIPGHIQGERPGLTEYGDVPLDRPRAFSRLRTGASGKLDLRIVIRIQKICAAQVTIPGTVESFNATGIRNDADARECQCLFIKTKLTFDLFKLAEGLSVTGVVHQETDKGAGRMANPYKSANGQSSNAVNLVVFTH